MLNYLYMIRNIICNAFEKEIGRFQENKALLVAFRTENKPLRMIIYTCSNYVGVYTQKGREGWNCLCYHDSCWRYDGVEKFLFENKNIDLHESVFVRIPHCGYLEDLTIQEEIVHGLFVITLSEILIKKLHQARVKKYNKE